MKRHLAVSASVLFHPLLMPLFGIFLIFNAGTHISFIPIEYRRVVYAIVFTSSCILPVTMLILLKQMNLIKSFTLDSINERIIPLVFTGLFYFIGFLILNRVGMPLFLNQFVISSMIALLLSMVITLWWKISIHMLAIGGITGAFIALSLKMGLGVSAIIIALFIFSGIVGSARLYLNAHTPMQVLAGFFVGLITVVTYPFI